MSTTTAVLLALAKEAADLTNVTDYVTDPTWTSWINLGIRELHRLVTNKFKPTFFRQYDFTLAAGQSQITLPSNFWRLKGLDIDPDTPRRRTVRPYNFQDRNALRQNDIRNFDPLLFTADRFYNVIGSSLLKIQAQEQAAGNYRLYYTPAPRMLGTPVTLPVVAGSDKVDGSDNWTFANLAWLIAMAGDVLVVAGASNGANNATRNILSITSPTQIKTDGVSVIETFGAAVTATLSPGSIDAELEPYVEYIYLTAAIKSLAKEESFAQVRALTDQRNLIRDDLTEALETDQGGPQTIVDTDDWGIDA